MLQDFSLDPVAVRQVFTTQGIASGRWTWLLQPGMANIYDIPVYNFPGWMLIMMYATTYILIGRWWFRRSGYKPAVGTVYPLIALVLALITMVSPLSQFLLWLAPFGVKGSNAEWIMLCFHLVFPAILLAVFWRGRMKYPITLKGDFPIFAVVVLFHLSDVLSAVAGGFTTILWLILLAGCVHIALLGLIYWMSRRVKSKPEEAFLVGP